MRRKVVICLTSAEEEHLQEIRQVIRDRLAVKLADLPAEQLQSLIDGLAELSQISIV